MLNKFKKLRNKSFCEKKFLCTKSTDKDIIIYERVELEKKNIKTLRALAKEHKINLQQNRKKSEIINIVLSFFLKLKSSDIPTKVLPMKFDIITDSNANINISLWFRGKGHLLSRCVKSSRFKGLVALHCKIEKKPKNDIIIEKNGDLFVNPILALHAASFLSVELYYEILDFYLSAKYSEMEKIYNSKIESL